MRIAKLILVRTIIVILFIAFCPLLLVRYMICFIDRLIDNWFEKLGDIEGKLERD